MVTSRPGHTPPSPGHDAAVARVRREIDRLYGSYGGSDGGSDGLERTNGVVHVASVFAERPDEWRVLKIGPHAPASATDGFVLSLARARADAIVTTGKILRDEPELRYALGGELAADLEIWRRKVLGRTAPPAVVVLTRSAEFSAQHPALHGWATPIVLTGQAGLARASTLGVPTDVLTEPSLRTAIAWARHELGARTIVVEAGPSSAADLYGAPPGVDELMLSMFEGSPVDTRARGGVFVSPQTVRTVLGEPRGGTRVHEPSGPWRFWRFVGPQRVPARGEEQAG